jgi:hypothetical protein
VVTKTEGEWRFDLTRKWLSYDGSGSCVGPASADWRSRKRRGVSTRVFAHEEGKRLKLPVTR